MPNTTKIYLAALYSRREEMEEYAIQLMNLYGYDITSRWVFGGEEGFTEKAIAIFDLEDVDEADTIVAFSQPYGTLYKGGGRNVELGWAMAKGKRCVLIGERENVFMSHPIIEQYDTLEDWLATEGVFNAASA